MSLVQSFSWLHLTDLHYGQAGQGPLWPNVRQALFADLKSLHKRCGPWQAVFFTGDLVFSGREEDFEKFENEVLARLWKELDKLGSGDAVLLAVPGNHDLVRPPREWPPAVVLQLKRPGGFREIEEEWWSLPEGQYRQVCTSVLSNYDAWWRKTSFRKGASIQDGLLPGDFATTLHAGSRRIGIVGLNTTFLQIAEGDYRGRLAASTRQLEAVCKMDVVDWITSHDVCLLLTHQGPDWLDSSSEYIEINPAGRFAAHLFGHMHETAFQTTSSGGGKALRHWQTTSLFGLDRFADSLRTRRHGYSAGRIEFGANPMIRFWPRRASRRLDGWDFNPDFESCKLLDDQGSPPQFVDSLGGAQGIGSMALLGVDTMTKELLLTVVERQVPAPVFAEIRDLLTIKVIRTDCEYVFTFKKPYEDMPAGYFVLRRDLTFMVTNLSSEATVFPVHSTYSGDEDLSSAPWQDWHFHREFAVGEQAIPIEEGRNLFERNGQIVLEEDIPLAPGESKKVFLRGEEPCRLEDRTYWTQGSPVVGIQVEIKNEYPEAIASSAVSMKHPGASEMIREPDRYRLERAFLPGQGFEVVWRKSKNTAA